MVARVFLVTLIATVSVFASNAANYEGSSSCGAMKVTVKFVYDEGKQEIQDLEIIHQCNEGTASIATSAKDPIAVAIDGSFADSTIRGVLKKDGSASGEILSQPPFLPKCADGQSHALCTKWTAHKK